MKVRNPQQMQNKNLLKNMCQCNRCGKLQSFKTCSECVTGREIWARQRFLELEARLLSKIKRSKEKRINKTLGVLDLCDHPTTDILKSELFCTTCGEIIF